MELPAAPGEALVYHRGFLAVDATGAVANLTPERQRTLRGVAAAALRSPRCETAKTAAA